MVKKFRFYGKEKEELIKMPLEEFVKLIPSRQRRSIKRGLTDPQKRFLEKIRKAKATNSKKPIKTHCRDMIIIPEMLNLAFLVHQGKTFTQVIITEEMLGHYISEFTQTRNRIKHSSPGIGATRSSAAVSVK